MSAYEAVFPTLFLLQEVAILDICYCFYHRRCVNRTVFMGVMESLPCVRVKILGAIETKSSSLDGYLLRFLPIKSRLEIPVMRGVTNRAVAH